MIDVLIPTDVGFSFYDAELRSLYENLQDDICDTNSFEFIRDNTLFYCFLKDKTLFGAIYYFLDEDNKLYVNAFAKIKYFFEKLEVLKKSLHWFSSDIYAQAQNRASAYCLLKCGFKRLEGNLFIFKR